KADGSQVLVIGTRTYSKVMVLSTITTLQRLRVMVRDRGAEARPDPRRRLWRSGTGDPPLGHARRRGPRHAHRRERRLLLRLLEAGRLVRRGSGGGRIAPLQRDQQAGSRVP